MFCRRDKDRVFLFQVSENFGLREGKVVRCERESENYQMIKITNEIGGERGRCELKGMRYLGDERITYWAYEDLAKSEIIL